MMERVNKHKRDDAEMSMFSATLKLLYVAITSMAC